MAKYLSESGLAYYDGKQKERLAKKADLDALPKKVSDLTNDAGYITGADVPEGAAASATTPKMDGTATVGTEMAFARGDHIHPTDTSRLSTTGDGSQVTVSFNPATEKAAPASGDTLAVAMGKLAKNFTELGELAYKDTIATDQLDPAVKASLSKADTALQSFTEEDPTVPAWAKEATKPSYTASEVGAIPASELDNLAKKSDLTSLYKYKGTVATKTDLPAEDNTIGDVWNVDDTDMNYGWTGEEWDPMGSTFTIDAITNEEIDTIMST